MLGNVVSDFQISDKILKYVNFRFRQMTKLSHWIYNIFYVKLITKPFEKLPIFILYNITEKLRDQIL